MPKRKNYAENPAAFQPGRTRAALAGLTIVEQVGAVFRWRLAEESFENAVEMRQRLTTDFVGDVADPQVGIEQQVFRFLNPHARDVMGEGESRNLSEHFAKVEPAGVDRLGDVVEPEFLGLMVLNKLPGARDERRLGVLLADDDLVAQDREMLRENGQQFDHGVVMLL